MASGGRSEVVSVPIWIDVFFLAWLPSAHKHYLWLNCKKCTTFRRGTAVFLLVLCGEGLAI